MRQAAAAAATGWWRLRPGLALVVLTAVTRAPALIHPQAIDDERIYTVVANEILDGGRPYADAIERKPPLLFWAYASIYQMVGKYNWPGFHAAAVLWTLLTMGAVFLIGSRLFDRSTGLAAALVYCIFQPWLEYRTLALNGEVLMNLPLAWGAYLCLRPSSSRFRPELLVAGALFALGFLLKQPAAIAAVPFGIYLLLPAYRRSRGVDGLGSLVHAALLTLGFAAVLAVVVLVLKSQGILSEAYYWTITNHQRMYIDWREGLKMTLIFAGVCIPLVLGAIIGARRDSRWSSRPAERAAILMWVLVSLIGVSAGGRFYAHYFVQLVLPLAVLAAPLFAGLWSEATNGARGWLRPRVVRGWLAFTVFGFFVSHVVELWQRRDRSEVGRYIEAHSAPTDRMFVWGNQAGLYLDARRRPASRYVATSPLMGHVFGDPKSWDPAYDTSSRIVPGSWDNLLADFARHPPRYIVDTDAVRAVPMYLIRKFPVLDRLLAEHYRLVHRAPEGLIYARIDG